MTVISVKEKLAARRAELRARYPDVAGQPIDGAGELSARQQAYLREARALYRAGYRGSLDGLYVVAAFDGEARNWLQELGRTIYYRNPQRYHVLLPLLGKQMEGGPLCPQPGRQPDTRPKVPQP